MILQSNIVHVEACVLRRSGRGWAFAAANAEAIARYWQDVLVRSPHYFDGTVHLLTHYEIIDGRLSGELVATNFASFLYWRDQGYPDTSVFDCFGSALLRGSDGRILLGRQSPGHINSGLTYLPGGFIDERDIAGDGSVDIVASVTREVSEEMGYPPGTFAVQPGAYVTRLGQQVSIAVPHVSALDSDALLAAARGFLATEVSPELEDVVSVGRRTDLDDLAMPAFARALVQHLLD